MAAPRFRTNQDGSVTYFGADPTAAGGGDLYSVNQGRNVLSLLDPNASGLIPRNYLAASRETVNDPQWLSGDFAGLNLPAPAAWFDISLAHPEYLRQRVQSGDADGGWNEHLNAAQLGDFIQTGTRRSAGGGSPDSTESFTDGAASNYIRPVWMSPDQLRYVQDIYDKDGKFLYRDLMDDHNEQMLENAVVDAWFNFAGAGWAQGLDKAVQAEDRGDESGIYKGLLQAYASTGGPGSNYAGAASGAWNAYDAAKNDDWLGAAQSAYNAYNAYGREPTGSRWKTGTVGSEPGTSGVDDFRRGEIDSYETDGRLTDPALVGGNQATTGGNMWNTGYFDDGLQDDWSGDNSSSVSLDQYNLDGLLGQGGQVDPGVWDSLTNAFKSGKASDFLNTAMKLYSSLGGNASLAGAVIGALANKGSKEQTQTIEPWGPAQPYLRGLLSEGADLYGKYRQQPFSPAEQTAYRNTGNVLDFANANAGRFMSGFDATAAGKNQFSRNDPRKGLIGNSYDAYTSPVSWQPGLLNGFGTQPGGTTLW